MIDLLVVMDVKNLRNKDLFEKHLQQEGFELVPNEKYTYQAKSTTTTFATKAYILNAFAQGLQKTTFDRCQIAFLLNETMYPTYIYDKKTHSFEIASHE